MAKIWNTPLKRNVFAAIILVGLLFGGWKLFLSIYDFSDNQNMETIKIGNTKLIVELADTVLLQQQGLSNRDKLQSDEGMLFLFQGKDIRNFWMKDMRFALDVLWLADNRVVGLQDNILPPAPGEEPARFQSFTPADMVLEVNSGWIKEHGIKIGDNISYPQI